MASSTGYLVATSLMKIFWLVSAAPVMPGDAGLVGAAVVALAEISRLMVYPVTRG